MSDERETGRGGERPAERERFDDLKEAYALGALDEEERLWFEGYLEAHPELRAEADELLSVADLLALAPDELDPPPNLRRDLLTRIGAEAGAGAAGDAPPTGAPLRRARTPARRGRLSLALAALASLATVLLVAGLFLWNASLREENEQLRGAFDDRRSYELVGSGAAQDVRGEVLRLGDGRAVLVTQGLPEAPEGQTYEAWLLRGGVPEPAGLFVPQEGGTAAAPVEGSLEGAEAVAVTVEPSGGSPMPTSDILLTATL